MRLTRLPCIVLAAASVLLPAPAAAPAAALAAVPAADVHGEPDRYVGTGGLILPGTVSRSTRRSVAGCLECQWRLTTPCIESALGHPFDGQSPCSSVVRGCPGMRRLLRVWFAPPGEGWREIGLVCLEAGIPLTVRDVGQEVRDRFVRNLDLPRPAAQPASGAVAQLPVVFDSGQGSASVSEVFRIAGEAVSLEARPSWLWNFGDGTTLATSEPGGRYPQSSVAHAYRHAGAFVVEVTAIWSATFVVDGLGPFPVPEPVVQQERLPLTVGEGRAVLAVR